MRKSVQRSLVGLVLLVALLALAAPAFALPFSFSEKQTVPGVTEHTIWAENQIAIYKLPLNVTHVGVIHVAVTFDSNNVDYDLYVIDQHGTLLNQGSGSQGVLDGGNEEVVDASVTSIENTGHIRVGTDRENLKGDPYWIIVVVYGGSGKFELSGYYPRLDPSSGWSTLDPWDWFIKPLPPISSTLQGAPYGGPWDFKATSRGLVKLSFQWPADVKTHVVSDDLQKGLQPVQFCEDLYRDSELERDARLSLRQRMLAWPVLRGSARVVGPVQPVPGHRLLAAVLVPLRSLPDDGGQGSPRWALSASPRRASPRWATRRTSSSRRT